MKSVIFQSPRKEDYKKCYPLFITEKERNDEQYFPTLIPNWDHTPRSGTSGWLFTNSCPGLFKKHCDDVLKSVSKKPENAQICFLKSWNEWGEGNYMEPDLKYGHGYINALKQSLSDLKMK
jgi:hypothetical protein